MNVDKVSIAQFFLKLQKWHGHKNFSSDFFVKYVCNQSVQPDPDCRSLCSLQGSCTLNISFNSNNSVIHCRDG